MALNLPSKYAKRMYEMLSQFKDTGMMQITVEELKKRLGLIDLETGKERYKDFAWFKRYVLDIAQKELAEHTDISSTYTAKKTGKKYTHLEFQIKYTARAQDATQLNAAAQPPQKTDVRKGAQKQHSHPDLEGETLNQYLMLTEEFRWLDKKLAYKVVKSVNNGLKELASLVGITVNLTMYVARHTYATVLKRSGVAIPVISEAMGHATPHIT